MWRKRVPGIAAHCNKRPVGLAVAGRVRSALCGMRQTQLFFFFFFFFFFLRKLSKNPASRYALPPLSLLSSNHAFFLPCSVCRNVSSCQPGEELLPISQEGDAAAALACSPCTAGHLDLDADPTTPCSPCGQGVYVPPASLGTCEDFLCLPGTVDADLDPSTPCQACSNGTFQHASGQTQCAPLSVCSAGQRWVPATGSHSSDRDCAPCVLGKTYNAVPGLNTRCHNVSTCRDGFGVSSSVVW